MSLWGPPVRTWAALPFKKTLRSSREHANFGDDPRDWKSPSEKMSFLDNLSGGSPIKPKSPTVSVVIPTYNRAHLVTEAVDSVLNQSYTDFELLVIDDGSTDDTTGRLAEYGDRIQLYHQENRGASVARNTGIQHARGKYIAFLDSDDLWVQDKLQAQMDLMARDSRVKICYTEEIWIRRGVRVNPKRKHRKYSGWILDKMLPLCIVSPSSVLMAREVFDRVGLFDESLPVCEDYDLWLRIGLHYPIVLIDRPLIVKRGGHVDQLSRKYWGLDQYRVQALQKLLAHDPLDARIRAEAVACLKKKCQILAAGCLKRGKEPQAREFMEIASTYQPSP
jgi:glycosyltransferase involved in cell wall biosynthesis